MAGGRKCQRQIGDHCSRLGSRRRECYREPSFLSAWPCLRHYAVRRGRTGSAMADTMGPMRTGVALLGRLLASSRPWLTGFSMPFPC